MKRRWSNEFDPTNNCNLLIYGAHGAPCSARKGHRIKNIFKAAEISTITPQITAGI
jgi:hypothetical protein